MCRKTDFSRWRALLLAVSLTGCGITAVEAGGQASAADRLRGDVLTVDRTWARAHQTADRELMRTTLAADLRFVHTNGDIDDLEKELTRVTGTLETRPEVLDFRAFGDTAIVIGKLHIRRQPNTAPSSVLYTHVYVRRNGVWLMVSHHATDLPSR